MRPCMISTVRKFGKLVRKMPFIWFKSIKQGPINYAFVCHENYELWKQNCTLNKENCILENAQVEFLLRKSVRPLPST